MAANFLCEIIRTTTPYTWSVATYWLSGLLAEQGSELLGMLLEKLCNLSKKLLPLLNWGISPCWECFLRSGDSVVHILLSGNGNIPEFLSGSGVDTTVDLVRATLLAIDNVVELLEVES